MRVNSRPCFSNTAVQVSVVLALAFTNAIASLTVVTLWPLMLFRTSPSLSPAWAGIELGATRLILMPSVAPVRGFL